MPCIVENSKMHIYGQGVGQGNGSVYYLARYCDPMEGRFIQKDPIAIAGGINLYAYVEQDPVNWIDPLGLQATTMIPGFLPIFVPPGSVFDPGSHDNSVFVRSSIELLSYFDPRPLVDWILNKERDRGLPPEGLFPPVENPEQCKPGPASRPSEGKKGGKSVWDPAGGEWRYFPEDKWHNPHWDYNPHDRPKSPWQNVPINGLPPRK